MGPVTKINKKHKTRARERERAIISENNNEKKKRKEKKSTVIKTKRKQKQLANDFDLYLELIRLKSSDNTVKSNKNEHLEFKRCSLNRYKSVLVLPSVVAAVVVE